MRQSNKLNFMNEMNEPNSVSETRNETRKEMDTKTMSSSSANFIVRPDPDLADLIPSFQENRRNELGELKAASGRGDFEFIRRMAHTWKGICRPYGFVHLETLSRSLEEAGEREAGPDVDRILAEVGDYLDNVRVVYDS